MINRRLVDFPRRLQPFTANSQLLLHCFRSDCLFDCQSVSQSVSLTVFFALLSFHSRLHQLSSTPQPSPVLPSHAYHSLPTLPLSFSLSSVCFFSLSFSAFISYHCVCLFTPGSRFVVSGKRNVAAHCECDKTSNCGSTLAQLAASFVGRSIVPTL